MINLRFTCSIPEIKTVQNNSHVIIGHAYGAHKKSIQRELRYLSNQRFDFSDLPSFHELENNIKDAIIISGDGGGFSYLPRISCLKFNSNKYIVNGIGEKTNDRVLILHNKRISQILLE